MKRTHKINHIGFTLMELLVVVLIIGILFAIATPQYFKMVERARISEAHAFISQFNLAQVRYKQRHGIYATTWGPAGTLGALGDLDIEFPGPCSNFTDQCGMTNFQLLEIAPTNGGGGCSGATDFSGARDFSRGGVCNRIDYRRHVFFLFAS